MSTQGSSKPPFGSLPTTIGVDRSRIVDLGMNIQAAGDAARFHHIQSRDRVDLESNLYALVGAKLAAMGYDVRRARSG